MSHPEDIPAPQSEDFPAQHPDDIPASHPDDAGASPTDDTESDGLQSRGRTSLTRRLVGLAVGVLAVVGAAYVILWLPPSEEVKTDTAATVLEYELAREATWPKSATLGVPLSRADEHMLAVTLRTRVARYAAGDALDSFDAEAVAAAFSDAAAADPVHVIVRWKGEVVYYEFVRHLAPEGVVVRAGVLKAQRVGRVDALHQEVYARRWVWHESAEIDEYTLRRTRGTWKVVAVEPWGTCGPDGEDVVQDPRPM